MGRPNYRVVLSYDSERKVFIARVPELPHCTGEGSTRSEAILKVEEELDALLANMAERGTRPPLAVDERELTGELTARVSKGLQRELLWQAQIEGVEVGQLISELLSGGLEHRRQSTRRPPQRGPHEAHGPGPGYDQRPRHSDRFSGPPDDRGDRGGRRGGRFPEILEDRAHFIEYVRNLEGEGRGGEGRGYGDRGRGEGRGHGGPGHGGHSHGGHGGPGHGGPGGGRRFDRDRRRGPEGQGRHGGPGGERAAGEAPGGSPNQKEARPSNESGTGPAPTTPRDSDG